MRAQDRSLKTCTGRLAVFPYTLWAAVFVVIPMGFVAYYAFTDNTFCFTLEHLKRFFAAVSDVRSPDGTVEQVHTYLLILARSVRLALISTAICLLIGYPLAYHIAHTDYRRQKRLMLLIMIPMWMNFLIRTYAWMTILQDTGVVNTVLHSLGLRTFHLIGTETAVVIGMVYDYLPYMVLPLYSVMIKLDDSLLEAARDLGGNGLSVMLRVVLPLSLPGIVSGITMVLIPSISTFYISQKLGSGKIFLIGDAIEGQYAANNLHFAAAMAFVLIILLLLLMAVIRYGAGRFVRGGGSK